MTARENFFNLKFIESLFRSIILKYYKRKNFQGKDIWNLFKEIFSFRNKFQTSFPWLKSEVTVVPENVNGK
jgi:hypothetical protein